MIGSAGSGEQGARELRSDVSIIVTGSLAFDHIMTFPGHFKDHILPDKVHILNVSFLVNSLKRQRGGTAGNIAYSAALLGLRPRLLAAAGGDFAEYRAILERHGVDTGPVFVAEDDLCASAFITTDRDDNQITGFYPGAMLRAGQARLRDAVDGTTAGADGDAPRMAIIAANEPSTMVQLARECRELSIPHIFDPGQGLPVLSGDDLVEGMTGARVLIANDYEMALIVEKTGLDRPALRERVELLVTTYGEQGSEFDARGEVLRVPAAPAREVVDPTGAGDAYRAGLMLGLTRGFPLELTGRIAAQAATYAVEHLGTQEHHYTPAEFSERFNRTFPDVEQLTPELLSRRATVAG